MKIIYSKEIFEGFTHRFKVEFDKKTKLGADNFKLATSPHLRLLYVGLAFNTLSK